jgi:hypothetical protein
MENTRLVDAMEMRVEELQEELNVDSDGVADV